MNFTQQRGTPSIGQDQRKENAMPDPNHKVPQNVPGPYYVDDTCIDCDQCRATAPQFFARHNETGFSYVHRQPVTPEEFALAEEARLGCPSESIGDDGVAQTQPAHPLTRATI
jgi:ferredoxin